MKLNLILGAGVSGLSIAKLLLSKGEAVLIADDNLKDTPESLIDFQQCIVYKRGLGLELADLEVDRVIKAPGISNQHPLIEKLSEKYFMYSDVEIAYQYAQDLDFIGISGSNGKTTVTSLLSFIANDTMVAAGNIGIPLGDVVLEYSDRTVALELSSFQCEGLETFRPKIATILNLSPDHMDRYFSVDQYYQAKLNMLKNMSEEDIFIRNRDDLQLMKRTQNLKMKVIDVSLAYDTDVYLKNKAVYYLDTKLFDVGALKLVGLHNLFNAMVAGVIAYLSGIEPDHIQERISQFKGVEHRIEFVDEINGVRYYNDSKATNPEATQVALESFSGNIHLLVGGYDKHISYELLKPYAHKLSGAYVYGQTKDQLKEIFIDALVFETMEEALLAAHQNSKKGDVVLLSPASASYDQFKNYEQRGQLFKEAVGHLGKKK